MAPRLTRGNRNRASNQQLADTFDREVLAALQARIVEATPEERLTLLSLLEMDAALSAFDAFISAMTGDGAVPRTSRRVLRFADSQSSDPVGK